MSDFVIKPIAVEISLSTTPNTVATASLVRLLNTNATTARLITKKDASNTVLGTITINMSQDLFIAKSPTDTLEVDTGTDVKATSVAFK